MQVVGLGMQWPTIDPFLFCAHHDDAYPAGNDRMGPAVPLTGRPIGSDFTGTDGWSMYHGSVVPGFPQHPHRGFETVTIVRGGLIDHSDSLGATARFGRGDVQWLTAGAGIVHCEMFPLVNTDEPNPLELFQIWLNLPRSDKMVDPYFTMFWSEEIPRIVSADSEGRSAEVTVIAGELDGVTPLAPPPNSWAARADADVAIWHLTLDPGASWTMPAATGPDTVRVLYVYEGNQVTVHATTVDKDSGVVVRCDRPVGVTAGADTAQILVLQGRPIGEPVAQHGPFVMNDREGIEQAFRDYQRTGFGGWPWAGDDPVHERDRGRFARHADGRVEEVGTTTGS